MKSRVGLLCADMADGRRWMAAHSDVNVVALVPVTCPKRVRGLSLHMIMWTDAASASRGFDALLEEARPALLSLGGSVGALVAIKETR